MILTMRLVEPSKGSDTNTVVKADGQKTMRTVPCDVSSTVLIAPPAGGGVLIVLTVVRALEERKVDSDVPARPCSQY